MRLKDKQPPPPSPIPAAVLADATSLTGALQQLADDYPDYAALIFLDRDEHEEAVTLRTIWETARRAQAMLLDAGLKPGGVALLALPTSLELVGAYFGCLLAGGIPGILATPFNRYAEPGVYANLLDGILRRANADVLYCEPAVAKICATHPDLPLGTTTVLQPDASREVSLPPDIVEAGESDIAMVQYSSGSTGAPKGVLLSHRALLNNMRAMRAAIGLTPRDVSVHWIPLYHDMGLLNALLHPLIGGSPTVIIPTADFLRRPDLWLWGIHHYRGNVTGAPNFSYTLCASRLKDAEIEGLDLSCLRIALNGAEPVLVPTIESFAERFRPHGFVEDAMCPTWGLAEAVCVVTSALPNRPPYWETVDREKFASDGIAVPSDAEDGLPSVSVGPPLPTYAVEIRSEDGRALPERHVGRVWVRGPALMTGYQADADGTARVLVDGWADTGDRAYLYKSELFFVSRDKDLIVIGGEKYTPHDVETAINRVAGVRTGCAVACGVMNIARGTEEAVAVIETNSTDEEERAQIRRAVRQEVLRSTGLGLRAVLLVGAGGVEKTTSGKLARSATARRYTDELAVEMEET